jgi:hypothetical protein
MYVAEWTDEEIECLIEKRKIGNNEFHYKYERNKKNFGKTLLMKSIKSKSHFLLVINADKNSIIS